MRVSDWRLIEVIGLALGLLFILGGIGAWNLAEEQWLVSERRFWWNWAVSLFIFGAVFLVVGIAAYIRVQEYGRLEVPKPPTSTKRFCSSCGYELPANAKFCVHCGKARE